jgi:hypothetical protein
MAAELAACAPAMPRCSPMSPFKALRQDFSGCVGKLNIRIFNECHHGRISPFAPHGLPQSLFT